MRTTHLICRVKRPGFLVLDDVDRRDLRATIARRNDAPQLGQWIMDTHVHAQFLGPPERSAEQMEAALHEFTYRRNRRHPEAAGWEREKVTWYEANDPEALAISLKYIHQNPVKAKICKVPWHSPWGSAREFAGLSRVGDIDVRLARTLLGEYAYTIGVPRN